MTTWTTMFGSEPIDGDPVEFDNVAIENRELGQLVEQVEQSFSSFTDQASSSFVGESAVAYNQVVAGLRKRLRLVPDIASQVQSIMERHSRELEALREAAESARVRAAARWSQRQTIARNLDFALQQPDNQAQVDQLERDLEVSEGYLERSAEEWRGFFSSEDLLDRQTEQALNNVSLGDLEDGFFDEWWGQLLTLIVLGPIGGYVFLKLLEAYQENGWSGLLWKLNEYLGYALLALAVVGLLVPGLGWGFAALVFGLAALKFGTSLFIKLKGIKNPETGEEMSWLTVGIDGVSVIFAGFAGFRAYQAYKAATTARAASSALGAADDAIQVADDAVGVADDVVRVADDAAGVADDAIQAADDAAGFTDDALATSDDWDDLWAAADDASMADDIAGNAIDDAINAGSTAEDALSSVDDAISAADDAISVADDAVSAADDAAAAFGASQWLDTADKVGTGFTLGTGGPDAVMKAVTDGPDAVREVMDLLQGEPFGSDRNLIVGASAP